MFRARLCGPGGFEKKLVVKQILPELASDPDFIELFVREANTLVQMSHPNLVPVYELGEVDGVYFLAMEWVQGATIAELLREGPLPSAWVAHVGAQIAEALRYAHERFQIVHRDVTPRNVIIDAAGQARLLDFGIAAKADHTGRGEIFGSPGYMAPEQTRGEPLGPRSDLFSLGAVLYEAATGSKAAARSRVESSAASDGPALAAMDALALTDPALGRLIARMLAPEAAARPQAAAEVAVELRTWLAERHPQGVERELGARAQSTHSAREALPSAAQGATPKSGNASHTEARSIATSPVLAELLKQATERLPRPNPPPAVPSVGDELANDPEMQRTVRRFVRDAVVVAVALVVAVVFGLRAAREGHATEHALPRSVAPTAKLTAAPSTDTPIAAATQGPKADPPTPAAPPRAAETPRPSEADKPGFVTLSALPWAQVRLDGRSVGVTPRRNLPLRPGKHTLAFECPPLGKQSRTTIDLHPGQALQVVVDLHTDPPKVTLR